MDCARRDILSTMKRSLLLLCMLLSLIGSVLVFNAPKVAYAGTTVCPDGAEVTWSTDAEAEHACDTHTNYCQPKSSVLGLPTWYKYLPGKINPKGGCDPQLNCDPANANDACNVQSGVDASKLTLIGLAIIEMLLRLAGLITVGVIVAGGIKYITSQGQPDATKSARQTIINGLIGMTITIIATISINFGANLLQ